MSIPRNHHYLPQFYLERWARDGLLYRFMRPLGRGGALDCRRKPPKAVAYQRDLYHDPVVTDPAKSQYLEMDFFQRVDDRGAVVLRKLDTSEIILPEDQRALAQFLVSLLHRSPSRLTAIRSHLSLQTGGTPYERLTGAAREDMLKSVANKLLALLVQSPQGAKIVAAFKPFVVDTSGAKRSLITSDRPVTVSGQLIAPDAFMLFPYAPDRLLIMTRSPDIARAFRSQKTDDLVVGINRAIAEQSEDVIIATDDKAKRMIDNVFLRHETPGETDTIGLIRRRAPLVNLLPNTRSFSRHSKIAMKYLGS